jgi:hypothetical protein
MGRNKVFFIEINEKKIKDAISTRFLTAREIKL